MFVGWYVYGDMLEVFVDMVVGIVNVVLCVVGYGVIGYC